jgi:hypothetical protein
LTICNSELTPIGCSGLGARDSEEPSLPSPEYRDPRPDTR